MEEIDFHGFHHFYFLTNWKEMRKKERFVHGTKHYEGKVFFFFHLSPAAFFPPPLFQYFVKHSVSSLLNNFFIKFIFLLNKREGLRCELIDPTLHNGNK